MTARAGGLFLCGAAAVAFSSPSFVSALQNPAPPSAPPPLVIQVGLDLIQMDAVITDKSGRPVTDLRTEDFTLEIDGQKQPIANAAFFGQPSASTAASGTEAAGFDPNRTLVFIVDDLNMSFQSMVTAKRALAIFAKEMETSRPLVALRLASDTSEKLSLFRSGDRLATAASALEYNIRSSKPMSPVRTGSTAQPAITSTLNRAPLVTQAVSSLTPTEERRNMEQRAYSLITTLNSMRGIPGRKALVFVSEGFYIDNKVNDFINHGSPFGALFDDTDLTAALRMVTEVANRASVVLYTVDPRGLIMNQPGVGENVSPQRTTAVTAARWDEQVGSQASLQFLADDTGGLAVANRNDLQGGFGDVLRDQGAYYLIGFEPPDKTFAKKSGRPKFHKIRLSVNRKDARVRTRAGFYGVTDEEVGKRAPVMTSPE